MKSGTGEYSTTIRKCNDGTYSIEIFALYNDGGSMGLNACQGITSLELAQKTARDWMFEYEVCNSFAEIPDDGGDGLRVNISVGLGSMLGKLAKDAGVTKGEFLDMAVIRVREFNS